jgi:ribonucleoside-diphosphate reductase beta chain
MSKCELSLYTNEYIDTTKEPLFFGCARNTQRYDKNRYEKLANLALEMQRFFWVPEEIKLLNDKSEFENTATIAEKHILTTQLQKLVMLDSLQGRTPLLIFGQLTTNPEFEACLLEQEYFEARIHSRSYSYIVEEMYANPSEIFDDTWKNKELRKEIYTITREYNILYDLVTDYLYYKKHNIEISEEFMHKLKNIYSYPW